METVPEVAITIDPSSPTIPATTTSPLTLSLLSYNQWPIEELQAREQLLTEQIHKQSLMIGESESEDVAILLTQKKMYGRLFSVFSIISKIIGAMGPIALIITTAFSAPSASNYVIAGISGTAVPLYHFAEQMRVLSMNYEKQAMTAYNNNVIDLQKVKAARKVQQEVRRQIQSRRVKKKIK